MSATERTSAKILRPSAYFWNRFQLGSIAALVIFILASVILVLAFHLYWIAFSGGAAAVSSQTANIAGLVQRKRELRRGYTTLPWLAFRVALRDPSSGKVLAAAGSLSQPFATLSAARQLSNPHLSAEIDGLTEEESLEQYGANVVNSSGSVPVDGAGWRFALATIGLGLLAFFLIAIVLFAVVKIAAVVPVAASVLGLVLGVVIVAPIFIFPTYFANHRTTLQLRALSDSLPGASLLAVRSTVESFGEVRAAPGLADEVRILSLSEEEIALWSGSRDLTKVVGRSSTEIRAVQSGLGHDVRGRDWPALKITFDDGVELPYFVRRRGAKALWPADATMTAAAVKLLAGRLGSAR